MSLNEKSGWNILDTFHNPKSIIDSDSKSESDDYSAFVDDFDHKAEGNCKMSKSNTSILNNISGRWWIVDIILAILEISIAQSWTTNNGDGYLLLIITVIDNYHI